MASLAAAERMSRQAGRGGEGRKEGRGRGVDELEPWRRKEMEREGGKEREVCEGERGVVGEKKRQVHRVHGPVVVGFRFSGLGSWDGGSENLKVATDVHKVCNRVQSPKIGCWNEFVRMEYRNTCWGFVYLIQYLSQLNWI